MINILVAGVGGQGLQIVSRMLCVLASTRNWDVVAHDDYGLAEMGASTTSHVRIANRSESISAPKITRRCANLILSFEPMEAARNLAYLSRSGQIVTAISTVQPPSATLNGKNYTAEEVILELKASLNSAMVREIKNDTLRASQRSRIFVCDDTILEDKASENGSLVPIMLLAEAIHAGCLPFTSEELEIAVKACVNSNFRDSSLALLKSLLR